MEPRPHILVIEDDFDIRDALTDILVDEGYRVTGAEDGRAGLELLGQEPVPDLVLLDLMMPDFDGFEFREAQVSDPRLAAVPVVVLTADRRATERMTDLNVAGYLAKPVNLDELLDTVRRLCAQNDANG